MHCLMLLGFDLIITMIVMMQGVRGGHGSDGSGFGENRCPSIEIRFMDYPSVDRHGSVGQVERI
jgi:hypothetical protein